MAWGRYSMIEPGRGVILAAGLLAGCVFAGLGAYGQNDTCDHGTIVMAPMRDGTLLKTRVTLPIGDGPWPVLLSRTPNSDVNLCWSYVGDIWTQGYAVVNQTVRGRFGSQGENITFVHDGWGVNQDGYDTVLWILEQPWCNGKVGVFGGPRAAI